jgi:hypothetical protein
LPKASLWACFFIWQAFRLAIPQGKPYSLRMGKTKAILTGDLIASTKAGAAALDRAMGALQESARDVSRWAGAETCFTRHRGDGWQMYLDFPGLALRACLKIVAELKAANYNSGTRISVGLGEIAHLGTINLSDAAGDAFNISGQMLDLIPKSKRWVIVGDGATKWQEAIFDLAEWQSSRWSPEQGKAVAMALNPDAGPQAALAAQLGITRQAFQARLNTAGFQALGEAVGAFESTDFDEKELP